MFKSSIVVFVIFFSLGVHGAPGSATTAGSNVLAFPTAEGFGAYATGGRGGEVRHVRTLKDSGPGSFREAVSKPNAIVLFDVAGSIELKSICPVASNLTLAGQSAPGDGVCLSNYEVSFSGSQNDIVRYLRFRVGITPGQEHKYAVALYGTHDMILDHCSIEWAGWDCIGMSEASNITLQYCIIGPGVAPQRFGCLCESDGVTFSHNLWISNKSRNPKAKGIIQYVNNVVYNWGVCGLVGGHSERDHQLDVINNYFIKGPDSGNRFTGEYATTDKVYQSGNMVDLDRSGTLGGRQAVSADFSPATPAASPAAIPAASVTLDSAEAAYKKVTDSAGASLHRDSIDAELVSEVLSLGKKGNQIGNLAAGSLQTDIPTAVRLSNDPPNPTQLGPDGYSNIERYLDELCPPVK